MFKEAKNIEIGKIYRCAYAYDRPKVTCILDNRGVFMPINTNTHGLFERIYGIYEY